MEHSWNKRFDKKTSAFILCGLVLITCVIVYMTKRADAVREDLYQVADISDPKGAIIETNFGTIEIAFLKGEATSTIKNFIKLSDSGFYDGTKFHRIISGFMIQGGDPTTKGDDERYYGTGGPGYTFPDEINAEKMVRGVVAMANAGPDTNGSQFFIVTGPQAPWIQGKHTIFAKVVKGIDVAIRISTVGVKDTIHSIPVTPIIVKRIMLK